MSATVETLVEDIAALKVEVEVGPDVAKEEEVSFVDKKVGIKVSRLPLEGAENRANPPSFLDFS